MKNVRLNPQTLKVEAEELGVDNLILIFAFILAIRVKVISLFKKFNVMGLVNLGLEILEYGNVASLAKQAWAEFKDLKPMETKQVVDGVKKKLELPEDQKEIELQIEEGLDLIPEGHELVISNVRYVKKVVQFFQRNQTQEKIAA